MPVLFHCNSLTNRTESNVEDKGLSKPPTLLMQTATPNSSQNLELTINVQSENRENHRRSTNAPVSAVKEDLSLESLNQLNNNVLPPFRASLPISPWLKVVVPPGGFKCLDCGDTFLLECSLKQHLERRSVYIQFPCDVCNMSLVFYNRCSLLAHLRNHKTCGEVVDILKTNISPLSKELLIGNMVSPVVQPGSNGASTCSVLLSHLSRETGNDNNSGSTSYIKTSKYRCPECFHMFDSLDLREDHFGSKMSSPATASHCPKCPMVCPSKCSLQAHQRIHMRIHPYVCPECGEQNLGSWEKFMNHLNHKCLHFTRHVSYNCFICESTHMSSYNLQSHIIKSHTNVYFKCQTCPMAFKSLSSFDQHKKITHLLVEAHCKTIFKCPLCDTVFHGREQLLEHLTIHIKEQLSHTKYIFKCPDCLTAYNTKLLLVTHLETAHPKHKDPTDSAENSLGLRSPLPVSNSNLPLSNQSSTSLEPVVKFEEPNREEPVNCTICDRMFQNRKSYNVHYKHIHSNIDATVVTCNFCSFELKEKLVFMAHEQDHLKEGKFVCLLCHSCCFVDEAELEEHLKSHVEEYMFPTYCILCDKALEDSKNAIAHLEEKHFIKTKVQNGVDSESTGVTEEETEMPIKRTYTCHVCGKTLPKKSHLRRHLNRMHRTLDAIKKCTAAIVSTPENESDETNLPPIKIRIPKQLVKPEGEESTTNDYSETQRDSNSSSPVIDQIVQRNISSIPLKKLRLFSGEESTDYICAKCDFSCAKSNDFKAHILVHRKDASSLQCSECGTCFVVETSLRKHLVISHRVPNVEDYMNEARVNAEGLTKDIICNSTTNTWQCRVCCKSFDNEGNLKFHMRSHGMAFIRSRPKLTESLS